MKWLSETALRCAGAATTGNRRKQKKQKSKPKKKPATRSATEVRKLTTHDLLELSHALASSAKETDLPPEGITDAILVLEDVITGRKVSSSEPKAPLIQCLVEIEPAEATSPETD